MVPDLARQMFDPTMLCSSHVQPIVSHTNPTRHHGSSRTPVIFQVCGSGDGKAIYDGRLLDAYFARSLYRQILGKPVDYRDVEWIDHDAESLTERPQLYAESSVLGVDSKLILLSVRDEYVQ